MYNRILVAIDGSTNSQRAAVHAAYLASMNTSTIVDILYVLDGVRVRSDLIENASREDLHSGRVEKIGIIEELFLEKDISYTLVIKHGEPGPTIIKYANQENFDLVCIGSRGLNSFQEMVLGSVSHKIAKRVNAPVLIIK